MRTTVLFENDYCMILSNGMRIDKILNSCMQLSNYFNEDGILKTI